MVNYISQVNCVARKFTFSMTTNGVLLHKYIDYLVEHNFKILISLDGNDSNSLYRVDKKGNSSFKKVLKNIDNIYKQYPEFFENNINFNAVLHNKNSVEGIYSFIKNRFGKIPNISELNTSGIKPSMQELFLRTYKNQNISLHQSENYSEIEQEMFIKSNIVEGLGVFLHNYSGFVYRDYNELLYCKLNKKTIPTGTCFPFSKKMFVTVSGKIMPCERIGFEHALGEITNNQVKLDFSFIAEKYNTLYNKINKQCSKCFNQKGCMQCMFNLKNMEKPVCYGFMNESKFQEYKNFYIKYLEKNPEMYYKIMEEVIVQ
jgi:uncharacterized protein